MGDISRVHVSQDNALSSDNSVGTPAKLEHHLLDDMPLFLRAVAYSGLQNPLNAVAEIADQFGAKIEPHLQFINAPEAGSSVLDKAQLTVGGALGMLVPYAIGGAASKKILALGAGEEAVARLGTGAFSLSLKESALTGGLTGLVLTPSQPGHNFWESRAYNSLSGAATFSLMSASALKMKSFSESVPLFKSDAFVGAASGFAGGAVNTQMDSLIQGPEHKFATLGQTIEGAATMSVLGGAFGAMHDARATYKNYYSSDGLGKAVSDDAGSQLPVTRAMSAGNLDPLADTTRGADAHVGAETVGSETVGSETVGSETVGSETVGSETGRADSTRIQSAPSPIPDLDIFKDEKVLAILRQTPRQQQMPEYIANYLQAAGGIPEATGPAKIVGDDGTSVTPWRVGEIRKTSDGRTVITNNETASSVTYDQYGRVTESASVNKAGNQSTRNFVYGEDGHLIAAVDSDPLSRVMNQNSGEHGWFRGQDGWIEGLLYKNGADFDQPDPTRTLAVSKAGNFVSGKGGSAEVYSAEGSHFRINDYAEGARRRIEQLASDVKNRDLTDLYSQFKAAADERIKSPDALAALDSLMKHGSADEIRNFLIKTNELFSQGSPDNIMRVDIRGSRDGSTWATVTRYDAITDATIEASTAGVTQTRKGQTTLTDFPDGSKTFKQPHPDREFDYSTAYYGADGRLNKIEFKAPAQASSVRTYSRDAQGNVIGLTETNSNGTTKLFQQGADWVVQMRGSDGKLTDINYKNAQVTAGDDGAISIKSTTDNTGISFDPHGTREIRTRDGRVQAQRPNGRVDYTGADIAYERGAMQRGIEEAFPEERARRERFRTQAGDFEKAAAQRGLSQGTVALTLAQVNRILTEPSAHWSARQRANLAELVLSHATNPVEISQGDNGTCNVTTVEHRLYALEPDKIAAMIADVSRDGKYTQANGKVIDASEIANGLVPDPEARRNTNMQAHGYVEKSKDGTRDFASQIAQSALIHTKWSEQTLYVSGDKVVSGNVASMEDSTGKRNMVYFQPKNLAPDTDADPNLVSLYSAGRYLGRIDPSRVEKMLDQSGAWLSELKPGETAYDSKGKPLVTHTTPGDISFAPAPVDGQGRSTGTSRLTLNSRGKQIPLVDADSKVLDGPQLSYPLYTSMYDNITGTKTTEPFVFSAMDNDGTSSEEELGQSLLRLGEAKKLPAIVVVNVAQPLFGNAVPGWHVLNVYDYDPATQLVRYSNQWTRASDRMDKGVPLAQLFQAMKAPTVTPTDSASGTVVTPPFVPPPRWLKWFGYR